MSDRCRAFRYALLGACLAGCGVPEEPAEVSGSVLIPPERTEMAATTRIPIGFSIPRELSHYTGGVPVTFGIPFAEGALPVTDLRHLITATGDLLDADFTVTATWPNSSPASVKWLLVDALIGLTDGVIPKTYFEHGTHNFAVWPPSQPITVTNITDGVRVVANGATYDITKSSQDVGHFELGLKRLGALPVSATYSTEHAGTAVSVEKSGKVRTTIKLTGTYNPAGGEQSSFVTRYRFYSRLPYVRIYHTMVWNEGAAQGISSLAFVPKNAPPANATLAVGMDGTALAGARDLFQESVGSVVTSAGSAVGNRLDGWAEASWNAGSEKLFVGVRWPWQQFPMRTQVGASLFKLHALGPRSTMSLKVQDQISPKGPPLNLENLTYGKLSVPLNVGYDLQPLSPRGFAKTYEYLVWRSKTADGGNLHGMSAQTRNAILQTPLYAFADPRHAVKAELPNPTSARDTAQFETIETALSAVFDWVTRQDAVAGDYGAFNFGDLQHHWDAAAPARTPSAARYWKHHGKGWSPVPWLLYLRSGERKYIENAEMHGRHLMDVDTCHVDYAPEYKWKGATTGYLAPYHFGDAPMISRIENESEYLGLYYRLTGYERAWDVIRERADILVRDVNPPSTEPPPQTVQEHIDYLSASGVTPPNARFNREHYSTLGELAAIYEETGDAALRSKADVLIDKLVDSQAKNGWLPGIKVNQWFSNSLLVAQRAFPARAAELHRVLERYEQHLGNVLMPSIGTVPGTSVPLPGTVRGPTSLWTLIDLERNGGDQRYLDVAAQTALAQALSVYTELSAQRSRGVTSLDTEYLGHVLRGWTATMARLAEMPAAERPKDVAPIQYFLSDLATPLGPNNDKSNRQWDGRHVLYVKVSQRAERVRVDLDFAMEGHEHNVLVRVHAPDGLLPSQWSFAARTPPTEPPFSACFGVNDLERLSEYATGHSIEFVPHQAGAYAVEILSKEDGNCRTGALLELGVWARATSFDSAGDPTPAGLVHYLPDLAERTSAGLSAADLYYVHGRNGGTVFSAAAGPSHASSGQFWFMPRSTGTKVSMWLGAQDGTVPIPKILFRPHWHRFAIFDADGNLLKATPVVGEKYVDAHDREDLFGLPDGSRLILESPTMALHSAVVSNDQWHFSMQTEGILPFLSATKEEWFDPTEPGVAHKPPVEFLTGQL